MEETFSVFCEESKNESFYGIIKYSKGITEIPATETISLTKRLHFVDHLLSLQNKSPKT